MTYTKSTDFAAKDYLLTGNPNKLIRGVEIDDELNAIESEFANGVVSKTGNAGSAKIPAGTQGQRDASPSAGYARFNSTTRAFEGYNGSEWGPLGSNNGPVVDIETYTATSGQTVFPLVNGYSVGKSQVEVFVNGLLMSLTTHYVETDYQTVTFVGGLTVGDKVVFRIWRSDTLVDGDAANMSYSPAGGAAVTTTVQTKLRESVSVKDFGAVADNATDSSNAFVLAEAALPAAGGTIYIDGVYYCASILSFTKKIRLEFAGGTGNGTLSGLPASYLRFSSAITVGPLVKLSNHGSIWQGGGIEGGGRGVNASVDNLQILGNSHSLQNMCSWKAGRDGIKVGNGLLSLVICNSGSMTDVFAFECGRHGVNLDNNTSPSIPGNNANGWTLNNVNARNNTGDGIALTNANLNTINGGLCESNTGWGLTIADGSYNVINGGDRETNTAGQFRILGSRNGGDGTNRSNYNQVNIGNYTELTDADSNRLDCTTINNSKNFNAKGTWVPVIAGSGGSPHASYTIQQGYWWRVGRNLKLTGAIQISGALSGPTGTVEITGLPAGLDSSFVNGYIAISIAQFNGITLGAGLTQLGGRVDPNTAKIKLTGSGSGTATAMLPVSGFGPNGQILFSLELPIGTI